MSREDDDNARLCSCFKKYDEIVKQVLMLDELTDSVDSRSRLQKRKSKKNRRGNSNGGNGSVVDDESFDEVIVQTITRFLHDLNTTTVDRTPNPSAGK
ncbi:hypothetical protein MANES_11G146100v8 [Manihot esculenta]|uniref:Uncharacterized protein n=1 Tax=Manihot esculenta TaxID=3983 RepID=A0A2C9V1I3_MANES|nr:hypothetical protein MANES_11G146100v8 [Manihot esculenta]